MTGCQKSKKKRSSQLAAHYKLRYRGPTQIR